MKSAASMLDKSAWACMASVPDNIPTYERPLAGLKIAVDAGNGSGGFYAEKVLAPARSRRFGKLFS